MQRRFRTTVFATLCTLAAGPLFAQQDDVSPSVSCLQDREVPLGACSDARQLSNIEVPIVLPPMFEGRSGMLRDDYTWVTRDSIEGLRNDGYYARN